MHRQMHVTYMSTSASFLPLSLSSKLGNMVNDGSDIGGSIQSHGSDAVVVGLKEQIRKSS